MRGWRYDTMRAVGACIIAWPIRRVGKDTRNALANPATDVGNPDPKYIGINYHGAYM